MRQVFASARLENVEAVAGLLRAEGIEVKISDGRSYRGNRRGTFSYRDGGGPQPAVWVVRAEDQPRARQLLRDAGLLESTRAGGSSFLPLPAPEASRTEATARNPLRLKLGLLALIALVGAMIVFASRQPGPNAPKPSVASQPARPVAPMVVPLAGEALEEYRAPVPTALARLLVERALAERAPAQACVAIDGADPATGFLPSLAAGKSAVFAASACPGPDAYAIAVQDYRTDGSGRGRVSLLLDGAPPRLLDVERDGTRWRVLGEAASP